MPIAILVFLAYNFKAKRALVLALSIDRKARVDLEDWYVKFDNSYCKLAKIYMQVLQNH